MRRPRQRTSVTAAERRRVLAVRGLVMVAILGLGTVPRSAAGAETWGNVRVPLGAHFSPDGAGFELGAVADLIWVEEPAGPRPRRPPARLAAGPLLDVRTVGFDGVGASGGIEVLYLSPHHLPAAVGGALGLGRRFGGPLGAATFVQTMFVLQLRVPPYYASGLFVRGARSFAGAVTEATVGLELGGGFITWLIAAAWGRGGG